VKGLTKAPSLSPRNSQQLKRDAQQIFSPASGTNSLLLKSLNPALGDTLDAALSNANVTPTPPSIPMLDCAAALRVKARLFGNNIPISPLPEIFEKEIESAFLQIGSRIGALAAHLQDIMKHFP